MSQKVFLKYCLLTIVAIAVPMVILINTFYGVSQINYNIISTDPLRKPYNPSYNNPSYNNTSYNNPFRDPIHSIIGSKQSNSRRIRPHKFQRSNNPYNNPSYNVSYYSQWPGSAIIDYEDNIHNKYNNTANTCNVPTLVFITNHKTGGYMKSWLKIFSRECNLSKLKLAIAISQYDIIKCNNIINEKHTIQHIAQKIEKCTKKRSLLNTNKLTHYWHDQIRQKFGQIKKSKSHKYSLHLHRKHKMSSLVRLKPNSTESFLIHISERPVNELIVLSKRLNENIGQNYIIIMMVRLPLETILSGYNYHAKGQEKRWTNKNLNGFAGHPRIDRRRPIKLSSCFKNIWNDQQYVIDMHKNTTMYKEYSNGFINNYANITALQYGLYLEFTRFVNCEYPLHLNMYQHIKHNNNYKWLLFLRFEWFHDYNYNESILYFLKQLGINNDRLLSYLFEHNLDIIGQSKRHATRGKYDKDLQIQLLLEYDIRICVHIKNMTLTMDGLWNYEQYC